MTTATRAWRSLAGAALLLALAGSSARAQSTLFFNGNFDGANALASEQNTAVTQSMVYADFVVGGGGWNVTELFGYYSTDALNSTTALWEIRSGITPGNGGTLLFTNTSAATYTPTGNFPFGLTEEVADVSGLSFFLSPGTYWIGISPIGDGTGRAFVETTSGAGGIDADNDGLGYWNSSFFGQNFSTTASQGQASEYEYGIKGDLVGSVVPEPSTMPMLAFGLVGLAGATRRRLRRA